MVGEQSSFICNPIDIGSAISHGATVVNVEIVRPDVIGHDDEYVGLLVVCVGNAAGQIETAQQKWQDQHYSLVHCFLSIVFLK
jgi:hypothetical protein